MTLSSSAPHMPFTAIRPQLEHLHRQTRARMLAALSPASRKLLGQIVADLAVAQNPNVQAAVQRLNAALTTGEKHSILQAQNTELSAAQNIMQTALAQAPIPSGFRRTTEHMRRVHETDAGRALLHAALLIGGYGGAS
jgi:hypothetical protein